MASELESAEAFVPRVAGGSTKYIVAQVSERDAAIRHKAVEDAAEACACNGCHCAMRVMALLSTPPERGDK